MGVLADARLGADCPILRLVDEPQPKLGVDLGLVGGLGIAQHRQQVGQRGYNGCDLVPAHRGCRAPAAGLGSPLACRNSPQGFRSSGHTLARHDRTGAGRPPAHHGPTHAHGDGSMTALITQTAPAQPHGPGSRVDAGHFGHLAGHVADPTAGIQWADFRDRMLRASKQRHWALALQECPLPPVDRRRLSSFLTSSSMSMARPAQTSEQASWSIRPGRRTQRRPRPWQRRRSRRMTQSGTPWDAGSVLRPVAGDWRRCPARRSPWP
jgi:hypothetical protein